MKRFRRWLFNGIAALSLLLCAATATIWVRSYGQTDRIGWDSWKAIRWPHGWAWADQCGSEDIRGLHLYSERAGMRLSWYHWFPWVRSLSALATDEREHPRGYELTWRVFSFNAPDAVYGRIDHESPLHFWNQAGFSVVVRPANGDDFDGWDLDFPHWVLILVTIFLPGFWLRGCFLRPRITEGHCIECGYDLRATPDRCPECGTVPPKREPISK